MKRLRIVKYILRLNSCNYVDILFLSACFSNNLVLEASCVSASAETQEAKINLNILS